MPFNHVTLSVYQSDRTEDSGKKKGGGMCFMRNKDWCDSGNIKVLFRSCSPNLELLRLYRGYLHQSLSQRSTSHLLALCKDLNCLQTNNPDPALSVAGDFNPAKLKKVMPDFHQRIYCITRKETLWITATHHSEMVTE